MGTVMFNNNLSEMIMASFHDGLLVSDFFSETYLKQDFKSIEFESGCVNIDIGKGFGNNCQLLLSKSVQSNLEDGTSKLRILRMGALKTASDVLIAIGDFTGNITVIAGSSGTVIIGNCGQLNMDLRLGHNSKVFIGDDTTSNGARLVAINSLIAIKADAMLSDEILIQGFDQHGILDLKSRKIINNDRKETIVGKHVWLGRRSTLMPGIVIGDGSIVGACSVVTSDIPSCVVSAGVPARVLKEGVSWCRPWTTVDSKSQEFFDTLPVI